jgi:hypothetical protein
MLNKLKSNQIVDKMELKKIKEYKMDQLFLNSDENKIEKNF